MEMVVGEQQSDSCLRGRVYNRREGKTRDWYASEGAANSKTFRADPSAFLGDILKGCIL